MIDKKKQAVIRENLTFDTLTKRNIQKKYSYEDVLVLLENNPTKCYAASVESSGVFITNVMISVQEDKKILIEDVGCVIKPTFATLIEMKNENKYRYIVDAEFGIQYNTDLGLLARVLLYTEVK